MTPDEGNRINLDGMRAESASAGKMTGPFEQVWSHVALSGTGRLRCEMKTVTRMSGGPTLHLFGVAPGVTFGILAGLLPGAACIQHGVLRFLLWASGTLPLRAIRFLNFATRGRLPQRVGGRYRFIHVLLRDHLAGHSPARPAA